MERELYEAVKRFVIRLILPTVEPEQVVSMPDDETANAASESPTEIASESKQHKPSTKRRPKKRDV